MLRMSRKTAIAEPQNFYVNGTSGDIFGVSHFEKGEAYDSVYSSVKAIANAFTTIRPYAIDSNGKPLGKTRLTDALARPNNRMSGAEFREALAVTLLTHRRVCLLVYSQKGRESILQGNPKESVIAGFAFLENPTVKVINNKKYYEVEREGEKKLYSEDYVIELTAGVDPYAVYQGYSPLQAAQKWANVDDFIAAFEAGQFENNAVPSGQFVITAPTVDAFNDIVDTLQRKHRGAGRNNNVDYVHQPLNALGQPLGAQIRWIPYSRANSELDLTSIFTQINQKLDSVFGVPASIRGVNDSNTYASVKVDEQIFIKYTVIPFAQKVWLKFTSELNRITGGLGYALTFDIDIPNVADEEKVDAERKKAELDIILTAREAGYSLDSIVDAFGLSNAYKTLEKADSDDTEIVNDKPEVQDDGENDLAPVIDPKAHSHCTCEACKTKIVAQTSFEKKLRKVLGDAMAEMILRSEENISAIGLEQYDSDGDGVLDADEIDHLIADIDAMPDERDYSALLIGLSAVAMAQMLKTGKAEYKQQLEDLNKAILNGSTKLKLPQGLQDILDGKNTEEAKKFAFNLDGVNEVDYKKHLTGIVEEYLNGTRSSINEAARAVAEIGGSKQDIKDAINQVKMVEQWKADRIARTEEHRATQDARIQAVKQLGERTGAKFVKVWKRDPLSNSCEFCIAMDGTERELDQPFIGFGETIHGEDGGLLTNTYEEAEWAQAHPNCRCKLIFRRKN